MLYGRDQFGLDQNLQFRDLRQIDTPYNTYSEPGCRRRRSPTRAGRRSAPRSTRRRTRRPATRSVVDLPDPSECFYFFYVLADEDGSHAFAATPEQHEANVQAALALGLL